MQQTPLSPKDSQFSVPIRRQSEFWLGTKRLENFFPILGQCYSFHFRIFENKGLYCLFFLHITHYTSQTKTAHEIDGLLMGHITKNLARQRKTSIEKSVILKKDSAFPSEKLVILQRILFLLRRIDHF